MMNEHSKRHRAGKGNLKAKHLVVPAFFLCTLAVLPAHAATNWVDGTAYGTDYAALAAAGSISSFSNGLGSLIIGNGATTNLSLAHKIKGFVIVTNAVANFKVVSANGASVTSTDGAAFTAVNATNLTITGGRFIGTTGLSGGYPPIPGQEDDTNSTTSAVGGLLIYSDATIKGSTFAGAPGKAGLIAEGTTLTVSNGVFRGGIANSRSVGGAGLIANDNSQITIHGGSFTGQVGNTAFYLQNSDATVYDGNFIGNVGGTAANQVAGDGLFSELTGATTNQIDLHGGTFSSLAFYGVSNSVQQFMAGTNLVVQNGIIQNGGTVLVDNQSDSALSDITVFSGTMAFPSNAFTLMDGGSFILASQDSSAVFGGLNIASNALFHVGTGQLTANDLTILPTGILRFSINETTNGFATVGTAFFQTNSTIAVDASAANFTTGTNDVTVLSATTGIYYGTTNGLATDADFTTNNVDAYVSGRNQLNDIFVDSGKDLRLQFTTATLRNYWNADGQLGNLGDDLDHINNPDMMAAIDAFDDPATSAAAVEQAYFTTMNTFQVALQGLQTAVGQSASRSTEFRELLKLPPGAKGPESAPGNEWRGWAKYYGQFLSHDTDGPNPEYDATLHGGVLGTDHSFGNLMIGLSGGAGNYRVTAENEEEESISAYHASFYGTYGAERAYLDAGIAYGYDQVEAQTAEPFVLEGEFDAQVLSAFLGGGYDLVDTKGGTVFTPEASIQYSMYEQEAYSETSTTAVPRNIDAFDADSLRSSVGLNVSMLNTKALKTFGFKVEGRFHWLHEFNPEPGNMDFGLAGGSNGYQLAYPNLDEELYRAGIGFTFFNTQRNRPKNVLLRLDFDELFGEGFNSHNLSAKAIYAF